MILYTYWRSSAAYRVRIALKLKGIAADERYIDLSARDQDQQSYRAVNPQRTVPSIDDNGVSINQSIAIIEYLEDTHPNPPLLPADPADKARVRAISLHIACEIHPLITPRTTSALGPLFGVPAARHGEWSKHWTNYALEAVEARLAGHPSTGRFCHGDMPTMADLCLIPQLQTARGQGVDLSPYPTLLRIEEACMDIEAFQQSMPERQPDCPSAAN